MYNTRKLSLSLSQRRIPQWGTSRASHPHYGLFINRVAELPGTRTWVIHERSGTSAPTRGLPSAPSLPPGFQAILFPDFAYARRVCINERPRIRSFSWDTGQSREKFSPCRFKRRLGMIDDAPRRSFLHSSATLNLSTRKLDLVWLVWFFLFGNFTLSNCKRSKRGIGARCPRKRKRKEKRRTIKSHDSIVAYVDL